MSFGIEDKKSAKSSSVLPKLYGKGGMNSALAIKQDLKTRLPQVVQQIRESAKIIAFKVDTTDRAIEGIRSGEHLPSLAVALALARSYKPMRDLLRQYMDAQAGESGESPSKILNDVHQMLGKALEQLQHVDPFQGH